MAIGDKVFYSTIHSDMSSEKGAVHPFVCVSFEGHSPGQYNWVDISLNYSH